jgi:DNA repair exonuclease SbcCD ATPase subunit
MPETNVMDDIERLENRMRTNFFEVEKRLANLESGTAGTVMDEIKERVQELEDLQMLIQAEFLQIKQQTGVDASTFSGGDLEKRVEKIEDVVAKGVPVAVQKDIESRLERVEKNSNFSEIRKMLDNFDAKLRTLQSSGVSSPIHSPADLGPVIKRIENLEKMPQAKSGFDPNPLNKRIDDIEKIFSQRFENLQRASEENMDLNSLLKRMEFNENMIKDTRAYYSKKIFEIEESLENSGKILTEEGMKGYLNRLYETKNEINRKIEQFDMSKDRLDKLLRERQELIDKLEQSEVNISKADALLIKIRTESSKMQNVEAKLNSTEERINSMIKDKLGDIEYLRNELFEKIKKVNERVSADLEKSSSLREELTSMTRNELEKSEYMKREMLSKADEVKKNLEKLDKKYHDSDIESRIQLGVTELKLKFDKVADELEKSVNTKLRDFERIKNDAEKTVVLISDMEKKINSRTDAILKKDMGDSPERIEELRKFYAEESQKLWNEIKRTGESLNSINQKIAELAIAHGGQSDPQVLEEIKKLWEETRKLEQAERDMESSGFSHSFDEKGSMNLSGDSKKQWEEIRRLEEMVRRIEYSRSSPNDDRYYENAARAFNDQLRKFASNLDSKLDAMQRNLYTKLYTQISEDLTRKTSQKSTDLSPVISQISSLERGLVEMQKNLKKPGQRTYAVIE